MSNIFKIGGKFLLPVTIGDFGNAYGYAYAKNPSGCEVPIYPADIPTLIPASTLTDLQAENAKLRTALTRIVYHMTTPNTWGVESDLVHQIAVMALGGGE